MPSSARPAAIELLESFARLMHARSWPWYVFGAQAVVAYGRPRMTADVDVTVDIGKESAEVLIRALTDDDFEPRIELSDDFISQARLLPLVHTPTEMPADVVISQPGLQEEFLARTCPVDIGGLTVPLISVEDLIAMKILAARPKDLDDIHGVLTEQVDRIDLEQVDEVLTILEVATDEADLKTRFRKILARVRDDIDP